MDYNLPDELGSDTTRKIRSHNDEEIANTPVLAITASTKQEDFDDCIDSRMNGIVNSPTTAEKLEKQISETFKTLTVKVDKTG